MPSGPLKVGIDARLFGGKSGGIEQMVIGLVDALSQFTDGDEQYLILAYPCSHDWIEPYIKGPCRMLRATGVRPAPAWKRMLKKSRMLAALGEHAGGWLARRSVTLSHSDGTIERAGVDVMHFMIQRAFFTRVPSIYHPHDLLYLHLPQLLSRRERVKRDLMLRGFCKMANIVSVTSTWVQRDVMRHYGLPEEKVRIVPLTGSLGAYPAPCEEDLAAVKKKFELPEVFVFYPAQTWPHKNHIALLEAVALLRDRRGVAAPVICSGHQNEHFAAISRRIGELKLGEQARFIGFVTPLELACLYRLCRCVAVPTLFEAASAPLNEAFMSGAAAACSNVTSLPEQAGDAAIVFNPHDPSEIADAIGRLWNDSELRARLIERGRQRVAKFTWARAARHFRALYRMLGKRELTAEDREILAAPPGI